MALGRFKTAGEVVNDAARELGLISQNDPDPLASTSEDFVRLVTFLKSAGQDLAENFYWRQLIAEAVLTKTGGVWSLPTGWTDAGGDVLNLPADWGGMVPCTGWDRTGQQELESVNIQEWQYEAANLSQPVTAHFRLDMNQVRLLPSPVPDGTFALEYKSRAWVRPAASGLGNANTLGMGGQDEPVLSGDFVLYDRTLIVSLLKLKWKRDTGFDTTTVEQDALRALNSAQSRQTVRKALHLSPREARRARLGGNIPEGNWPL